MKYTLKKTGEINEKFQEELICLGQVKYNPRQGDVIAVIDENSKIVDTFVASTPQELGGRLPCELCPASISEPRGCRYNITDCKRGGLAMCRLSVNLVRADSLLEDL